MSDTEEAAEFEKELKSLQTVKTDMTAMNNKIDLFRVVLNTRKYELVSDVPIGRGGFGQVFKVRHLNTKELLALKTMELKSGNHLSRNRFLSFVNEVKALKKNPHKNIIELIDNFVVKQYCFTILELANGGDLSKRLKRKYLDSRQTYTESEAIDYFGQIVSAIHFVHTNGLTHGDLKLENILIVIDKQRQETLKVTDFGCAQVGINQQNHQLNLMNSATGTVVYMSPEQLRVYLCNNLNRPDLFKNPTHNYNPFRSDIWALGICLYRLLFYEHPYDYDFNNELQSLPLMLNSMKAAINAPKRYTNHVSNQCMDLLRNLLNYQKDARIDIQMVVRHVWLRDCPHLTYIFAKKQQQKRKTRKSKTKANTKKTKSKP
ncbi:probable myosin light chain kinase DDB_G0271550 [Oppia nitens]|uniref:probable myosin light chain kinase DDB_G0271550 n=1 Tax=Oppia nitens TaxID=1686743 RepID=UPI0023DC0B4B|nr:probable myosin light chain kinase DDB_G0271550 [Oppia nitens]